jgi:hypothetical protein
MNWSNDSYAFPDQAQTKLIKYDSRLNWNSRLVKYIIIRYSCLDLLSEIQRACFVRQMQLHLIHCSAMVTLVFLNLWSTRILAKQTSQSKSYAWILYMTTFLFPWMSYFIKGVVVVLALWFCNRILIKVTVGFDKKKSKSNYSHDRKLFFENYIKLHI